MLRVGRVGRAHGKDGSFRVREASERTELLSPGAVVTVEGVGEATIAERKGTPADPIVRLKGIQARDIAGRELLVPREAIGELPEGEWLADDLVGLEVVGLGTVKGVWTGPSVDALQVETAEGELLVPLISDAILSVDLASGRIEADLGFLGLGERSA